VIDTAVHVVGARQLRSSLRTAGQSMDDLKDANAKVGALVAQESRPAAPRGRTGRLAASVRPTRAVARASVNAGSAAVPYAGPIHWGWPVRHIAAQPFIAVVAAATQPDWLPIYEQDLQTICDSVKGA
jgi:hypothetical protein